MMDPQALQDLGLTEDQIRALMELGVLNEERGIIDKRIEMARQLRQTQGPQGIYSGKTFTNASPLSFLSRGVDRAMGAYQQQQALAQQRENAQKMAQLRQQYLAAMLKRQQQAPSAGPRVPMSTPSIAPQGPSAASLFPMMAGGR